MKLVHKAAIIILPMVTIEIIIGYLIISSFKSAEQDHVDNEVSRTMDIIVADIDQIRDTITNSMLRDGAIFQLQGKLMSPANYRTYLQIDNDVLRDIIHSQGWIPRITPEERIAYETFYRPYYDANFTIRNITFVPNAPPGQNFIIAPIDNKTAYYPFTLSEPPFTLTLMGGDFTEGRGAANFLAAIRSSNLITASGRIRLALPNAERDYGTNVYHTVRANTNTSTNSSTDQDPDQSVIGQVVILLRHSVLVNEATNFLGIERSRYMLRIIDRNASTEQQIIYQEEDHPDTNEWNVRTYKFYDRIYQIQIYFTDEYTDQYRDNTDLVVTISYVLIAMTINGTLCYILYSNIHNINAESKNIYKQILTYVNHELRNPLVPITGLIDLSIEDLIKLRDVPQGANLGSLELVISNLYTVQGHTELMKYIIDDVLTYRKIKEGKVRIKATNVRIGSIIRNMEKTLRAKIRENPDVEFVMDIDHDLVVYADPFRINQIVLNFINNSIKFTNTGFIKLTIAQQQNMCLVQVEDTGCGVSKEMHPLLFKEFSQENGPFHAKGTGLGLFIVKQLTTMMGGKVGHKDRPYGSGSIFYVMLPLGNTSSDTETGMIV